MPASSTRPRFTRVAAPALALVFLTLLGSAAAAPAELARVRDAFIEKEDGRLSWTVGNDLFTFRVGIDDNGALTVLALDRRGLEGQLAVAPAPDLTFRVGSRRMTPGQAGFAYRNAQVVETGTAVRLQLTFEDPATRIRVARVYACEGSSSALEVWSVFESTATEGRIEIADIDIWRLSMPVNAVNWVTGLNTPADAGGRFTRQHLTLAPEGQFELGSATRSSETAVPVVWFSGADASVFGGLRWSGAWNLRVTGPDPGGLATIRFSLGDTSTVVRTGEPLESPHGFVGVAGANQVDVTLALQSYIRQGIRHGRPIQSPVTYNTWYAYGIKIDEETLRAEMDHAARIGVELFVVDAGWYLGGTELWDYTTGLGRWVADPARFPSGLRALSDYAHGLGMKFGLWVEPERVDTAIVNRTRLVKERFLATSSGLYHPDTRNAMADDAQICLGDREARQWVLDQITRLVDDVRADYLKWDNNYWINCNRTSHGHGTKDGNLAHVKGLYWVLGSLRERFPDLSIENCAGGGDRLDLGMLQYTDSAWMDDTTGPSTHVRHNLEGLGSVFPPAYLLSFVTDGGAEPIHHGEDLSLFFKSRMPGILGLTWRGSHFDEHENETLAAEIAIAKALRGAVPDAAAFLLTDQVLADGGGLLDVVQLFSPQGRTAAVLVFAADESDWFTVRLKGLDPGVRYSMSTIWGTPLGDAMGADLMQIGAEMLNASDSGAHLVLFTPIQDLASAPRTAEHAPAAAGRASLDPETLLAGPARERGA